MPSFASSFEEQQGCEAVRAGHHQHHQNSKQYTSLREGIRHRQQRTAGTMADYALIVPDLQWQHYTCTLALSTDLPNIARVSVTVALNRAL